MYSCHQLYIGLMFYLFSGPGSCDLNKQAKEFVIECNEVYNLFSEESSNFSLGWYPENNYTDPEFITHLDLAFKYFSTLDLHGLPYMGQRSTYGGGGYVADLGTSATQAKRMIDDLIRESWIDHYTRAVFLEFTVYNPNINLFAYVNFLMEFPATGSILPSPRIMSFAVYHTLGGMGTMVLICEICYVLILVYFMQHEFKKLMRERSAYWKEPWNVYEFCLIVTSVVGISMFALREIFGRVVMEALKENIGKFDPDVFVCL